MKRLDSKSLQTFGCCGCSFPSHIMAENQQVCCQKFKFFRILLLGFSTKLDLPQRLAKHFIKENFIRSITLLSPLGKSWNVRIGGDSKDLHFAEGWGRFAVAHGLSFGDLLVFKHVGGMIFHVTIFDKSTCEKDYKIPNIGSDDRGENYDQESESSEGKTTTPPSSGQRSTPPGFEQESNMDHTQASVRKEVQKSGHKAKKATYKQMCRRGSCFQITISPKHKYTVRIPAKFIRSNDLSGIRQMLPRDPKGHPWSVNLLHCKHPASGHDWLLLSAGWQDFLVGNELKDGDVCVFELIKKKNEMLVQILRSCGDGSSRSKSPLQHNVQLKRAASLQQKGSPSMVTRTCKPAADPATQFRSTIMSTSMKTMMINIPKTFLSLVDLSMEKEVVLVDLNSRRWPVKISHSKDGRCRMHGGGWARFSDENNLQVGDVCVFSFKYTKRVATFQIDVIKSKT